ncbi:MAG: SMP-30/gluconolactonase/LRE family protein [Chloroflexi bacterium]|nr:SMP-30/gluconolactonase/LRE family protein [Chloroflexota bacterium]
MDGRLEARDTAFNSLVPPDTIIERVGAGFGFTEGPVWRGDHLLFSDIPRNRIVRWRMLGEGPEVTTFRCPSSNANGNTLDRSGRLISCEHSARRVTRTETDGRNVVVADSYQGRRLNSPNDVVVRSDGSIYFTDPLYGLKDGNQWKEQPCCGVYRVAPDGAISLLVDDFDRPNGLAFALDEKVLYIDDTVRRHIRAFEVAPDGSLSGGRVLVRMGSPDEGGPDGMKVDVEGNIYSTGPGGIWVIRPDGHVLGRIIFPDLPANLAWEDHDWRTMYATARPSLYRLRVNVPGIPVC